MKFPFRLYELRRVVSLLINKQYFKVVNGKIKIMPIDVEIKDELSNGMDTNTTANNEEGTGKHGLVQGSKRKVAMLLAYCGENYHGMVMNRGSCGKSIKTIESELFPALVRAKVVPDNCVEDPSRMTYKIASRTDKGVSTCGQVASLKMILHEHVVDLVNQQLPHDIRVLDVIRVTKGFTAQFCSSSRTYSYTLPTYAFADAADISNTYTLTAEKLGLINSIVFRYKGTHTYHNFTSGKQMGEMSAQRYIMDFTHEPPFMHESIQFMTFKLKGQSFMIHQIRKMMGLMIAIVGGYANENYFVRAFSEPLVDIPKAPGTGLVLEEVHYDAYNKKQGHLHGGIDFSNAASKVEEFRQTRILPYIYRSEIENAEMMDWLTTMPNHDFTGKRAMEDWKKQTEARKKKLDESKLKEVVRNEEQVQLESQLPQDNKDNNSSIDKSHITSSDDIDINLTNYENSNADERTSTNVSEPSLKKAKVDIGALKES